MPPQSKPARRITKKPAAAKSAQSKSRSRRPSKTRALSVGDAVLREPLRSAKLFNPLAILEPLHRAVIDRQIEFFSVAMAWSPAHIMVKQQAAFWDAFADGKGKRQGKASPKRVKRK